MQELSYGGFIYFLLEELFMPPGWKPFGLPV
jgi:hypothetical protein